jgi:enoyl-CoA hydratase/carnithine racemase
MNEDQASPRVEDGLATIEIPGPGRNLLNPAKMAGVEAQLRRADADDSVTGIVLTGSGTVFCGGLDLGAIGAGESPVDFASSLVSLLRLLPTLTKPVAAAVNGDAVASGGALVAACDYAVSTPDALIGSYEVSVGVWPMVAQVPIIQRIGPRAAMENIASGEPFTAERAREVGLLNRVTDAAEVMAETRAWLLSAARAGAVMATGRPSVYELASLGYDDALQLALSKFSGMFEAKK